MTLNDVSYDDEREIARIPGVHVMRKLDNRLHVEIPDALRDPEAWYGVMESLSVRDAYDEGTDAGDVFQRAHLMYGGSSFALQASAAPEIVRFARGAENARSWLVLFGWAHERCTRVHGTTTLSQLGSDLFGDSKILRAGALKRQLFLLLRLFDATGIDDERTLFKKFGIVENPYTSHVTVFAPIEYTLDDGMTFDYPRVLFENGMACQLPLETVERISSVMWRGTDRVMTTSENAAPFARMVGSRKPCLYTEGYPNTAVKGLLGLLSREGVEAVHEGDADLDGLNIAEDVGRYIVVRRTVAEDVLARAASYAESHDAAGSNVGSCPGDGIAMTASQKARLDTYIAGRNHSAFESSYMRLKLLGRWFEQESFHEA